MVVDKVQRGIIELNAGLRVPYERVDWTPEAIIVPIKGEA